MKLLHQIGNSEIVIEDTDIPSPQLGEVLIKTEVSALCGSEMSTFRGSGRREGNLGHEAAGIVTDLGPGTSGKLKPGQRVGVSAIAGCGHCAQCQAGRYTWCDRFTFHCNMHAEYFTIPERACHPLPDDVSWDIGVLITGDGFGVPYHTSTKLTGKADTLVIFGLGPIGLGNILMQAYLGRKVIGIDRVARRLELAMSLGAAHAIQSSADNDVLKTIKELTDGEGADAVIEAAGVQATAKMCFAAVRKGGTVIFNGEQPALEVSPSEDFIRRDISAVGSWFYHFHEFSKMLELVREGLHVERLITHRYSFAESTEAYRAMQAGETGKVLLVYGE